MKMKFGHWALVALILLSGGMLSAHECGVGETYETVTLPYCSFRLEYGQGPRSLWLDGGWRHVRRIYVTAHSVWSSGGTIEVWANGGLLRTLSVTPYSEEYSVPIEETVRSIEFRYSSGDYVDITDVRAVVAHRYVNDCDEPEPTPMPSFQSSLPSRNIATWLANRAIHNVEKLIPYADPETEYVPYLLPIKTVAGRAHATAAAEGDLSVNTRTAMKALSAQIAFAEPVITAQMKRPVSFDMAVELLSIKHEIDDRLH